MSVGDRQGKILATRSRTLWYHIEDLALTCVKNCVGVKKSGGFIVINGMILLIHRRANEC